jgi:hypothetical protein
MGANSLNRFNKEAIAEYWDNNTAFSSNYSITVPVQRLETWIKNNLPDLNHIDYFHCDTQGSDLKVLEGMGPYINLIRSGKIECARNLKVKLYYESTNTVDNTRQFLQDRNFTITDIIPNDGKHNELNLHFEKLS